MKKVLLASIFGLTSLFMQGQEATNSEEESIQSEESALSPKISFSKEEIDYGIINQNSEGERKITITNNGSSVLEIKRISPSSRLVSVRINNDKINPGDSTEITITYNTSRVGKFNKNIQIFSNASESIKVLKVKGEIKKI